MFRAATRDGKEKFLEEDELAGCDYKNIGFWRLVGCNRFSTMVDWLLPTHFAHAADQPDG